MEAYGTQIIACDHELKTNSSFILCCWFLRYFLLSIHYVKLRHKHAS